MEKSFNMSEENKLTVIKNPESTGRLMKVYVIDDFIIDYIDHSRIKSVIYDNVKKQWKITYKSNKLNPDVFNSTKDMITFLHNDQNQE